MSGLAYFTADLHLGHQAILGFTERGKRWSNIDDHDNYVIDTINRHVPANARLFILGDLSMHANIWRTLELIDHINAERIFLVKGNHDKDKQIDAYEANNLLRYLGRMHVENFGKALVTMAHFPQCEWERGHYSNGWQLHGHAHGDFDQARSGLADTRMMDVGWDASLKFFGSYQPFSLEAITAYMTADERIAHYRGGRDSAR